MTLLVLAAAGFALVTTSADAAQFKWRGLAPALTSSLETGSIAGQVTDASTHAVLADIEVCLIVVEGGPSPPCEITNLSGEYTILEVPSGSYKVEFNPYVFGRNYFLQYYNGKSSFAEADVVSVMAGRSTSHIDAALQPGGQITGRVTDAATTVALEGVEVCAFEASAGSSAEKHCARTDSSGMYRLFRLATGSYTVEFAPETPEGGKYATQYYNGKSSLLEADAVPVTAGSTKPGIDAALQLRGQIAGEVTDATTGVPLEDVQACAEKAGGGFGCAKTNSLGKYTISDLDTGEYTVRFFTTANYLTQFYNGKPSASEATRVSVTPESTTSRINAAMQPGGQITGKATDASTKAPLKGIQVCAESGGTSTGCETTNSSGEYTISQLVSDSYSVVFSNPSGNYFTQYYNGKSSLAEADPVPVTAGSTTSGIDAAMQPGGEITGKVTDVSTNAPVESVTVCAEGPIFSCGATNSSGEYMVVGLVSGSYKVGFSSVHGYRTQYYNGKASLSEADPVSVTTGKTTSGINAALQPGGKITGKVTDASTKAPIEGIQVYAIEASGEPARSVTTDSLGEYTISGLFPGEYTVYFGTSGTNYLPQYYNAKPEGSERDVVSVTAGSTASGIDAALQPGGQITGTVIDASTKAPLGGIYVCVVGSLVCTATNSSGEYRASALASGSYKVEFAPGFANEGFSGKYLPQYYNGKYSRSEADPVSVTAGSATSAIDAALQLRGEYTGGGQSGSQIGTESSISAKNPEVPPIGRVTTQSGVVLIELPGTAGFVPLRTVTNVPNGTVIDATHGTLQFTSVPEADGYTSTGLFDGGIFRLTQASAPSALNRGRSVLLTVLTLVGPLPSRCKAARAGHRGAAVNARARTSSTARRLWGHAKGHFRTRGRYGSATVRGTQWLTEDTCAGTLIRVARGVVSVDDFAHHRTLLLRAPHSFISHPGRGG